MKKLILTFFVCLLGIGTCQVCAQTLSKADQKIVAKQAKELKKKNWETTYSFGLEKALSNHMAKVNQPNVEEWEGTAQGSGDLATLQSEAYTNASRRLAEYMGQMMKGRILSDQQKLNGDAVSKLISDYEILVGQKIEKELLPSYCIYKVDGNGRYMVTQYCTYNTKALENASNSALKSALEEQGLVYEYGNNISNFVNEGFK